MAITFEPLPEWLQDELLFKVEEKLTHLRIPRSLDGFDYLALAIAQVAQNPVRTRYITKDLYPEIAKLRGTSASNVERTMRTAVKVCWDRGGRRTLDEMAHYHLTERPTKSQFIDLVATNIRHTG